MARRGERQLTKKQEACLRLLICGEKSQKEIAQEVGISESLLSRWKNRDIVFSSRYREALEGKEKPGADEVHGEYGAPGAREVRAVQEEDRAPGAREVPAVQEEDRAPGVREVRAAQEEHGALGAGEIQGAHEARPEKSGAPGADEVRGAGEMQGMNEMCYRQEMLGVPGAAEDGAGRKREYEAQAISEKTAAQRYRDMEKAAADKLGQLLSCGDVKTEFQVAKEIIRLAQSAGEARGQEKADGMLESLLEGLEEV